MENGNDGIKSVNVLSVSKGDIIIFKYPGALGDKVTKEIVKSVKTVWGLDNKVSFLEEGMDILVLRPEK